MGLNKNIGVCTLGLVNLVIYILSLLLGRFDLLDFV